MRQEFSFGGYSPGAPSGVQGQTLGRGSANRFSKNSVTSDVFVFGYSFCSMFYRVLLLGRRGDIMTFPSDITWHTSLIISL